MSQQDQFGQMKSSGGLWGSSGSNSPGLKEMRDQLEAAKKAMEGYKSSTRVMRLEDKAQIIKSLQDRIKNQESYLDGMKARLKYIEENMHYGPGDIVVHTKYGNAIVQEVVLGKDAGDMSVDWGLHEDGTPIETIAYKIATKSGRHLVKPEEIMPYTESSKLLFEKK